MRSVLFGLVAFVVACGQAFAQQPAAPVVHPGAQRLAHVVLIDSGLLDQTIEAVKQQMRPTLLQSILSQPWAASLDDEKRRKVDAFVDTFFVRALAAIKDQTPQIEVAVATAYSEDFTAEESSNIADYFERADGLAVFKVLAGDALSAYAATGSVFPGSSFGASLTLEQAASLKAFTETPAGKAFANLGFNRSRSIMRDSISNTMAKATPALAVELRGELCAILGDPCPLR